MMDMFRAFHQWNQIGKNVAIWVTFWWKNSLTIVTFWATFYISTFNLSKQFKNMGCWRYFKDSKVFFNGDVLDPASVWLDWSKYLHFGYLLMTKWPNNSAFWATFHITNFNLSKQFQHMHSWRYFKVSKVFLMDMFWTLRQCDLIGQNIYISATFWQKSSPMLATFQLLFTSALFTLISGFKT